MQLCPSAFRGSRYTLVTADDDDDAPDEVALEWKSRDLKVFARPPAGLHNALVEEGNVGRKGSFKITANGDVLTKVQANLDQAPVKTGWIPVYLGLIEGTVSLGGVPMDPELPSRSIGV